MKEYAPNYYKDFSCLGSEVLIIAVIHGELHLIKKNDQYLNSENEDIKKFKKIYKKNRKYK